MGTLTGWMDAKCYPSFKSNWDDDLFRDEVLSVLKPEYSLLDLGAGAGIVPQMNFRGRVARACGVDPDERVRANPFLDDGRVGTGEALPYPADTFDVVISDNVVEHLTTPAQVFAEVARVLKPGGLFLFKTPNRRHYVATIARMTPHRFHQAYNRMRGRQAEDTFPTQYRANTRADVDKAAKAAGLVVDSVRFVEGRPEYLRSFSLGYLAGWAYERAVNASSLLESFRVILVARLRKP
jgi:SAM-dependent methyltransferase